VRESLAGNRIPASDPGDARPEVLLSTFRTAGGASRSGLESFSASADELSPLRGAGPATAAALGTALGATPGVCGGPSGMTRVLLPPDRGRRVWCWRGSAPLRRGAGDCEHLARAAGRCSLALPPALAQSGSRPRLLIARVPHAVFFRLLKFVPHSSFDSAPPSSASRGALDAGARPPWAALSWAVGAPVWA